MFQRSPLPASTSPPRLRLLFVVESGTDVRMVDGLAAYFVLTVTVRRLPGGGEINHAPASPVPVVRGPNSRLGFAVWIACYLARHVGEHDVVLVQGYSLAALACNFWSRIGGCRRTLMLVCSPVEAYYRCRLAQDGDQRFSLALSLLRGIAWLNARVGRGYVVLSDYLGGVVREHGTRLPIHRVPIYGVDTRVFQPPASDGGKASCKARRGLPDGGHILFFSSRIAPEKDAVTLLAAFRKLLDAGEDLWLLHRSGGYREFLQEARKFGVAGRVVASDACYPGADLADDYRACELCVQASREEGLGFSALEALACGTPVVATAIGGLRETIRPGDTGWTYPPGDVDALTACIRDALHNQRLATEHTQAGRRLVEAGFAAPMVFSRLERLFHEPTADP